MMARGLWMWSFPWLQEGRTELSIRPWGLWGLWGLWVVVSLLVRRLQVSSSNLDREIIEGRMGE